MTRPFSFQILRGQIFVFRLIRQVDFPDFFENVQNPDASLYRVVRDKGKLGRVSENDSLHYRVLDETMLRVQLAKGFGFLLLRPDHSYENLRRLEIVRHLHVVNGDEDPGEFEIPFQAGADLALEQLIYPRHALTHDNMRLVKRTVPSGLQLDIELLQLVTFDHVFFLVVVELPELDTALESVLHFLYIILEATQRRKPTIVDRHIFP